MLRSLLALLIVLTLAVSAHAQCSGSNARPGLFARRHQVTNGMPSVVFQKNTVYQQETFSAPPAVPTYGASAGCSASMSAGSGCSSKAGLFSRLPIIRRLHR